MSAFCSAGPGPGLLWRADQDISVSVAASALRSFSSLSCGNVSVVQLTGSLVRTNVGQQAVLQTLPRRAVICAYVLSSATLGTYRARSGVGTSIGQGGDPAFAFRFRLAVGAVRAF